MTDPTETPFAAFPPVLSDWSEAQSADFAAWFEGNFVADDSTREPAFSNTAAAERFAELRDAFYKARLEETEREAAAAAGKPPRGRGKAKAGDLIWVVSRAKGLHQVEAGKDGRLSLPIGGRVATDRDLKIAGVER